MNEGLVLELLYAAREKAMTWFDADGSYDGEMQCVFCDWVMPTRFYRLPTKPEDQTPDCHAEDCILIRINELFADDNTVEWYALAEKCRESNIISSDNMKQAIMEDISRQFQGK